VLLHLSQAGNIKETEIEAESIIMKGYNILGIMITIMIVYDTVKKTRRLFELVGRQMEIIFVSVIIQKM